MRFMFFLVLSALATISAHADENWPRFRGPGGEGFSQARNLPIEWSESKNIRWKTAIHDKGWSSPVVWGEQIWLTTAREDGKQLFALCLDRKTGKVVRDLKLFDVEKPQFCHPFNSYASSTPVIEAGRVYVHFGSPGTACLDTETGKVLWQRRDLECDHFRGAGSSPIVHGNLLFLTFDGADAQYVAALDKHTGTTVWKTVRTIEYPSTNGDMKKAYSTPLVISVAGKEQLVSPAAEATIAYDPATGTEVWRVIHGGMNEACCPLFSKGLLYLTSGHTAQMLAVRPERGPNLNQSGVAWKSNKGVPTRPSPLLVNDLLFLVNDGGVASCISAKDGTEHWKERLGGSFSSSPVCADGRIYVSEQADKGEQVGITYVFKAAKKFTLVAKNKLDTGCMATPALVGETILLRTRTHLYCIGKQNMASDARK